MVTTPANYVAVIGAGPAGLYATRDLAKKGVRVVVFNRDIKPGGMAEYGIFPQKKLMKNGLRTQFQQILALEGVNYYGNVLIGQESDLTLESLTNQFGFQAVLMATGAQGNRTLDIPGDKLDGVYYAKDIVYHYNRLPPFSQREYKMGRRIALVGGGNIMLDIVHYLLETNSADEITALIRRGPEETRFGEEELEAVAAHLDIEALKLEIQRVRPVLDAVGQQPDGFYQSIETALAYAQPAHSKTPFRLRFLVSPTRVLKDQNGRVAGLEIEENTLINEAGVIKARGTEIRQILEVETLIVAIGSRVDEKIGLPVRNDEFIKNPEPRFPVDGNSYELHNEQNQCSIENLFVAGWARKAGNGMVGIARKDGANAAKAVLKYLETQPKLDRISLEQLESCLGQMKKLIVTRTDLEHLEQAEQERARQLGLDSFKFASNAEMLQAIDARP